MKMPNYQTIKKAMYQLIPFLVYFIDPFDMEVCQRIIFNALLLTIIWWTTGLVNRNIACIFLLVVFLVFGNSTPLQIFGFALSPSFYLIMMSFMLSTGTSNSKVADRIAFLVLNRYGGTPIKLVLLSFLFGIVLIFIIPQPFSRVILLSSIYQAFINNRTDSNDTREVLLFSIFVASTTTSMLFINGDIILNYSVLQFGSVQISAREWLAAMFLPSLAANIIVFFSFVFLFKSKLNKGFFNDDKGDGFNGDEKIKMSGKEISAVIIMMFVILLWSTEALHGINPSIIAALGVIAMLGFGVLSLKDVKTINTGLLLFLTTVFAIGAVMKQSGVSAQIFSRISLVLPGYDSGYYLISVAVIVMVLHMLVGSAVTTLSVAVPSLVEMSHGMVNPLGMVLLSYTAVSMHYILPFHHATIMIGAANKTYCDKLVIKLGIVLTVITIVAILCLYVPWWKYIGLI